MPINKYHTYGSYLSTYFAVSDFLEACEDEVERGQIDFK